MAVIFTVLLLRFCFLSIWLCNRMSGQHYGLYFSPDLGKEKVMQKLRKESSLSFSLSIIYLSLTHLYSVLEEISDFFFSGFTYSLFHVIFIVVSLDFLAVSIIGIRA